MRKTSLNFVYELAKKDPRVVFVGSDLGPGVLDEMKTEMPDRFFMEGVSEQNIIGVAAGLAMEGFIPYVNTIATFLTRRCYEQVALDLCLHNLPVRLIANGGGVVYAPLGPTHLAVEDIAIMRALPNMTVTSVVDKEEMARLMPQTLDVPGPMYIRLAKGGDPIVSDEENGFELGKAIEMKSFGKDVTYISTGIMTNRALDASEQLSKDNVDAGVLHVHTIKPLDEEAILKAARTSKIIVTLEEHTRIGGLGSAVVDCLVDANVALPKIVRLGLPDAFAKDYGRQDSLLESMGLSMGDILEATTTALKG